MSADTSGTAPDCRGSSELNDIAKGYGSVESHQLLYEQPYGLEGVEDFEEYRPGGLHPVDLFDVLDGRFEVCHKLGSGGIATVWLCYEKNIGKWRAVKINAASRSHDDSPEIKIGKLLEKDSDFRAEDSHVVMPLEIFWIEGPNGRHLCTILPVLGPTLSEWRLMSLGTDASRINKACYQLTKGLDFLHSRGICHGDLRPQNVLMKLKDDGLDHLQPDQLFELLHYPDKYEVFTVEGERSPHAPKWVVEPLWWSELRKFISDDVAIVDFGEAFEESLPPKSLGIPEVYAAPEVIYGGFSPGKGSDIWSLAYSIMEIRTGRTPELSLNRPLRQMERFAGPIPAPYRQAAAEVLYNDEMRRFEKYGERGGMEKPVPPGERQQDDDRHLNKLTGKMTGNSCVRELELELGRDLREEILVSSEGENEEKWEVVHYRLPEAEVLLIADLLSQMFKYQPAQRISAASTLGHAWFRKIPERTSTFAGIGNCEHAIPTTKLSLAAPNPRPSELTSLREPVQKLVPTGTLKISSFLVQLGILLVVLAVLYHFYTAGSLC
ncbi:kinase-like protein [Xylaria sp. FL1777]|nr:kinase-like protein [Xylaria sp. FL1777]